MGNTVKHNVYVIGGLPRTGKTIVFREMVRRCHAITIQTDAVRAAIRKVLVGESYVSVQKMRINVQATLGASGNSVAHAINRTQIPSGEDGLAWTGVLSLLETYDRDNATDVIVEGVAATPEHIHALALKNLSVRAAFIGYHNVAHFDKVLAYAHEKNDWVQASIDEHGGGTDHVKEWVHGGVAQSLELERIAEKLGYGYFDVSARPFDEHIEAVVAYLLSG